MAETRYKNTNELVTMETPLGRRQKTAVAIAYNPGETAPKIGDMIPPELYEVVAEILVFVDDMERMREKLK